MAIDEQTIAAELQFGAQSARLRRYPRPRRVVAEHHLTGQWHAGQHRIVQAHAAIAGQPLHERHRRKPGRIGWRAHLELPARILQTEKLACWMTAWGMTFPCAFRLS